MTADTITFETPIRHRHAGGLEHEHGGSDDRELNRFLRGAGQIKPGETRPDGTYGDDEHSHTTITFGSGEATSPNSGPLVWSARRGDTYIEGTFIRTARKEHRCWARCGRPINAGEQYAEYVGEVGPYESGARYHLGACADGQIRRDETR